MNMGAESLYPSRQVGTAHSPLSSSSFSSSSFSSKSELEKHRGHVENQVRVRKGSTWPLRAEEDQEGEKGRFWLAKIKDDPVRLEGTVTF